MYTIRNGLFETNSSSMHSLIISKNNKGVYTEEELKEHFWNHDENTLRIWDTHLDFGRSPFAILTTFIDKLYYAIASLCDNYNSDNGDEVFEKEILPIIQEIYPNIEDVKFDTRSKNIYVDADGNEYPEWECRYEGYDSEKDEWIYTYTKENGEKIPLTKSGESVIETNNYGYIDTQSEGMLRGFLKDKNISLKEFLINKEYMVVIDGDEYDELGNLIKHNIIRKEDFDFYG